MCGICGIIRFDNSSVNHDLLHMMTETIKHRGPDDEGYVFINFQPQVSIRNAFGDDTVESLKKDCEHINNIPEGFCIGLGFRRLSIIDLSPKGHQPMMSSDNRLCIIFNGEIYNYLELRQQLHNKGYSFSTDTDTEVILASYQEWGTNCVNHFNGMWAFTVIDISQKTVFCSRDRFGIKPFYYIYEPGKFFIFASEIKSLLYYSNREMDNSSISDFLVWSKFDHDENTFIRDIKQLTCGNNIILKNNSLSIINYYQLPENNIHDDTYSIESAINKFYELFLDSIKLRLRSDVPVGFALSGGMDSSSIVCCANRLQNTNNLKTFSVTFPGTEIDEQRYIEAVTKYTAVTNYQITPTPDLLIQEFDKFLWHQESPNNGSSYFADYLLRKLISQNDITVSLEGQGADEIISGYRPLVHSYIQDLINEKRFSQLFKEIKKLKQITPVPFHSIIYDSLAIFAPSTYNNIRTLVLRSISLDINNSFIREYGNKPNPYPLKGRFSSYLNQKLFHYLFYSNLPPQLVRADKNAMASSLESRFPFLDYRLVEFCFKLPYSFKIQNGTTKYILRKAMNNKLPDSIINRKDKLGFATPESNWLRSGLKEWMMDIVYSHSFKQTTYLNWNIFENRVKNFLAGNNTYTSRIWSILITHIWREMFCEKL